MNPGVQRLLNLMGFWILRGKKQIHGLQKGQGNRGGTNHTDKALSQLFSKKTVQNTSE